MENETSKQPQNEGGGFFNFNDDSNEEYELILPPECELKHSATVPIGGIPNFGIHTDTTRAQAERERESMTSQNQKRRVSFDTSRNEYFMMECHQSDGENIFFGSEDDPQVSEFEIGLDQAEGREWKVYCSKIAHEKVEAPIDEIFGAREEKIEILEKIESKLMKEQAKDSFQIVNGGGAKPRNSTVNSIVNSIDGRNNTRNELVSSADRKNTVTANKNTATTDKNAVTANKNAVTTDKNAVKTNKKINKNSTAFDNSERNLFEYISTIGYTKDRLAQVYANEPPETIKEENVSSLEITFSDLTTEPETDDRGIIVENIPRISNNPFIMKDRLGKN